MRDLAAAIRICNKLKDEGKSEDELLSFLREEGYDKIDCIKALNEVTGMGLKRAKEIVHKSPVWRDVRVRDEKFHEDLIKVAQKEWQK